MPRNAFGFYMSVQAACEGCGWQYMAESLKESALQSNGSWVGIPASLLISVSLCLKSISWVCCQN